MATLFAATSYMDPFYYFGSADRPGINAIRHAAIEYPELSKARSVVWYHPRTLILGSSRAQIGLDPQHKDFAHRPVYNLAYPGSSMRRTLALFEHAVATNKIEQVVLSVDFYLFRAAAVADDEFVRLNALPDGRSPDRLKQLYARAVDFWRVSFSSQAIKLAAFNYLDNSGLLRARAMHWTVRRDGHNELLNPANVNYEASFTAVEDSFRNIYYAGEFCLSSTDGHTALGDFQALVRRARELGIDLRVVISPIHAGLAETIDKAGLWDMWEQWKRQIVRIAARESKNGRAARVFDFSGFTDVTTEPVPLGTPDVQMRNYWDPSHYKRQVGDRMLDVVLANDPPLSSPAFGRQIFPENIDRHLAAIRHGRLSWHAAAPAQAARVKGASTATAGNCPPLPDDN